MEASAVCPGAGAAITIFGATGDLAFRKLLPALYNMCFSGKLGTAQIIAVGRRDWDTETYRNAAREWVGRFSRLPYTDEAFAQFGRRLQYYRMPFTDGGAYDGLEAYYAARGVCEHVFYLAVAPRFFGVIASGLARINQAASGKVILEKPFGENLAEAGRLNEQLQAFFAPSSIYRIDHYLGKEMVRNIQTIRFANPIFADVWDARHIGFIEISALEDMGVGTRGGYYDSSGALRDMVQNHLLQILSLVAMEPSVRRERGAVNDEQLKVLRALRPIGPDEIGDALVLGQYGGYRSEPAVAPDSSTETYAALRLFIDNERWRGMPFYIRTGKKLDRREMEVAVVFRPPRPDVEADVLRMKIQPTEGVRLEFNIKKPGDTDAMARAAMDFCQSCVPENRLNTPEAYERLLGACLDGERAWFSQWDQIEAGWNCIDALRALYGRAGLPLYPYRAGAAGPAAAAALPRRLGHAWLL